LAIFEEGEDRTAAFVEPIVICLILIANATVGVVQETNAEKAIEELKSYEPDTAVVLRDGEIKKIQTAEIVVGDVVQIAVGDRVSADLRLIDILTTTFRIDQAVLTGESDSVNKELASISDKQPVIQDKKILYLLVLMYL